MKCLKQYIIESEIPPIDPVGSIRSELPKRQDSSSKKSNSPERSTSDNDRKPDEFISQGNPHSSYFITHGGKIIQAEKPPLSGGKLENVDHAYIPLVHPEKFGMSHQKMQELLDLDDSETLELHKTGSGATTGSGMRRLGDRGFYKVIHHVASSPTYSRNNKFQRVTMDITSTERAKKQLSDITEPLRSLRGELEKHSTPAMSSKLHVYGLMPHDTEHFDTIKHRLNPEHLEQLSTGHIKFENMDQLDRFLGTSSRRSRDPGSGVEDIPSPDVMRRKAGKTDEPESIQRGRFFTGDSYIPTFAAYLNEFTQHEDYEGNTLFAITPEGKFLTKTTRPGQITEHPDAFPELNFGRPTSWEHNMALHDEHTSRPTPIVHGRINHAKRMIQMVTEHGTLPYGDSRIKPIGGRVRKNPKDVESDVYNRISALDMLEKAGHGHYSIYNSHTDVGPDYHTFREHKKYLANTLNEHS